MCMHTTATKVTSSRAHTRFHEINPKQTFVKALSVINVSRYQIVTFEFENPFIYWEFKESGISRAWRPFTSRENLGVTHRFDTATLLPLRNWDARFHSLSQRVLIAHGYFTSIKFTSNLRERSSITT